MKFMDTIRVEREGIVTEYEPIKLIAQGGQATISLVKRIPDGNAVGMPIRLAMPGAKRRIVSVGRETPRGECVFYLVADPEKPYRLSIRAPTFINLAALNEISRGCKMADLFAILGSLDLVMGDVDR